MSCQRYTLGEIAPSALPKAPSCPKRLAGEMTLVTIKEARQRVRSRHPSVALDKLPRHIQPFAEYMVRQKAKPLSSRDIVKAYVLTVSSVQRRAQDIERVRSNYDYKRLRGERKQCELRPEDVMANILLRSKSGKRYLDAASRGVFDAKAAREVTNRLRNFGMTDSLFEQMKLAVAYGQARGDFDSAMKRSASDFYDFMCRNVKGIATAKTGFFASLLGRGDIPTFDAREINLWKRTDGKISWAVIADFKQRIARFPMKLPKRYQPVKHHLVHHMLWDAYNDGAKPSCTTHGAVIRAMQHA